MLFKDVKNKINNLETFPPSSVVSKVFDELLAVPQVEPEERADYAGMLDDLINRLSENYDVVTNEQSDKILSWIDANWNEENDEYVDLIIVIAMNVVANKAKPFIEAKMFTAQKQSTKNLLKDAYDEIKEA